METNWRAAVQVAVDVNGARYCSDCCVVSFGSVKEAEQVATESGYGGPVFVSDIEDDDARCTECGAPLLD